MAIDVFVSVGRTATPAQERFASRIEERLRAHGFNPRTVGRNAFSSEQPLRFVAELMEECEGSVIIAFERTHIASGTERRGAEDEKPFTNQCLPTVWNQIEAAMAYVHKHPLLVICENGLRSEGLLETGYDWYVQWVGLEEESLNTPRFTGTFDDWCRRVRARAEKPYAAAASLRPEELSLGQILSALTTKQAWSLAAAVITALAGVVSVAYWLGQQVG